MIVLIVVGCLIVAGAVVLGIYRYDNLQYMDHALDATWAAGFTEKQAVLSDGSTVNYAEGPDIGDLILLIHGQAVAWEDYYMVLPALAKDHHVYAIDCYGHGSSSHDASLYFCETVRINSGHDIHAGHPDSFVAAFGTLREPLPAA